MIQKKVRSFADCMLGSRFWALVQKEVAQLLGNSQLIFGILITPTVILLLFGFAFNPKFENLKIGITDYSNTPDSREFTEIFDQTTAFRVEGLYSHKSPMIEDLVVGKIAIGLVIPSDFDSDISQGHTAQVQAIYDAVDANTSSVASSYVDQLVSSYNARRTYRQSRPTGSNRVEPKTVVLYNPGLKSSWFIVSGMLGVVLTTVGVQTASAMTVHEKEVGTIEQLMMTPASSIEIVSAKILPLLVMLLVEALAALAVGRLIFGLPLQGSLIIFLFTGVLYFWVVVGIGILLASFTKNEQQCLLLAFFINPPLIILSGATTPISGMPNFMQQLTYLDPLRYLIDAYRSILFRGGGLETVWVQMLALLCFGATLTTLSIWCFRRQFS
jgi:ABC-2 type transport system permease protein